MTPFWMLVACILVNRTQWATAKPVFDLVRFKWPSPEHLAEADLRSLKPAVKGLGLYTRRSRDLRGMARRWLDGIPRTAEDVMELPGCGKYAADSWAIFVEGRTDVHPDDGKLTWYMKRRKR
jgi:adenine-specific DNA glycosylase